jgi:hypothetical protein
VPERSVPDATRPALFGSWFRPEKGITDLNVQLWDLAESEGKISGSAVVNGTAVKNPMGCPAATDGRYAVQGTRTADDVKLTIACPGYESLEFAGTIGMDAITGTISGSGLPPRNYVFARLGM